MVIILVFLTFSIAILIEVISHRRAGRSEISLARANKDEVHLSPAMAISQRSNGLQFPKELYYHNGHAWAKLGGKDEVLIGLDDLTQKVMGNIEEIEIPPLGGRLNQGEVAWKIRHGNRKLSQIAPLGGTVVEVNEKLKRDPTLANRSPYEEGWILKIKPKALGEEILGLMDSFQMKLYFDEMKAKLRSSLNHEPLGTVYGDGEEVITGASDKLDEKWWKILVKQLFHSSPDE